jgi:hypothetical protein
VGPNRNPHDQRGDQGAWDLSARQLFKGWLGGVHLDIAGRWDILVARRIATSIK